MDSKSSALGYLRRSRVDEARPGAVSHEAQLGEVRALAARLGFAEPSILEDWGRSGGGGKEHLRPAYRQLREAIDAGTVSDVIAYDLSRLTRSLEEWSALARLCRERGVRVHLVKEGTFDFGTASGEMVANILASVAQAVRRWAQERSAETARVRKARGEHIGRTAYGSKAGEDSELVRAAFLEAGAFLGAARLLNARGVPTRFGRPWYGSAVGWIIRQQYPYLAPMRPQPRVKARAAFAFYRLLRCHCGRTLTATRKPNGRNPEYVVYRCDNRTLADHGRPYHVPETTILPYALVEAARLRTPDRVKVAEANAIERRELEGRKARILDMREAGQIDRDETDRRLEPILAALERLSDTERVAAVPAIDWGWPPAELNAVLRALWERVDLDADLRPVAFRWRVPEWRA